MLADGNATIQVVYFKAEKDWLTKLYPIGARLVVSGEVEWFDMRPQIRHPDYVLPPERASEMPALEPVYRLTSGLSPKVLRRAIGAALDRAPELPGMAFAGPSCGTRLARLRDGALGSHTALRRSRGPARQGRPGSGSPSTSSWPASSRWRLSAAA